MGKDLSRQNCGWEFWYAQTDTAFWPTWADTPLRGILDAPDPDKQRSGARIRIFVRRVRGEIMRKAVGELRLEMF